MQFFELPPNQAAVASSAAAAVGAAEGGCTLMVRAAQLGLVGEKGVLRGY